MVYIPLFFKTGRDCPVLIVGGGEIACAKSEALSSVDAKIEVAAPEFSMALKLLAKNRKFKLHRQPYSPGLLDGQSIVIAATDDEVINERVAEDCRARGIPVNVVDNPALCDFIFPALIRRGPLQIAVSTSGVAPVLARMIKQTIEQSVPESYENLVNFLEDTKKALRRKLTRIQPRRLFLEDLIRGPIAEEVLEGNKRRAKMLFREALEEYPDQNQAGLYLIGAGPGHPELMTLKAVRLLSKADVVLYDRLIPPGALEQFARKDAQKIPVGKTRCRHLKKQEEIEVVLERCLRKGKIVARLKGGDPGVFGHGAEEIEVARKLGVPYQIVPGVSAVNGCAAYAGMPLTERGGSKAVRLLTLYSRDLDNKEFWKKLDHAQDETLVFYMSTPHTGRLCKRLIEKGFRPDLPLVVIEQGTTPYHTEYSATLESFEPLYKDFTFGSPCLLVIGDVTRWREAHGWKQAPEAPGQYFPSLPADSSQGMEIARFNG